MKPLRVKKNCEVTYDPVTGQERVLESAEEIDVLSDQGSIDSLGRRERYSADCGCYKPVGGRCVECGQLSCIDCHGRCYICSSPICLRHSIFVDFPDGRRLRFCSRCHAQGARRRRLHKVGRFLLSPFVDFEE